MSEQHTITEWLEFGDAELECQIEFTFYPGNPGKFYGLPEDCYPDDPPEIELNKLMVCTHTNPKTKEKIFVDVTVLFDDDNFADYVESKLWEAHEQYLNDPNDRDIEPWQELASF